MTPSTRGRALQIGLLLSGLLLLLFTIRFVSFSAVWTVLRQLSFGELLLLAVANLVVLLSFTGRWWLFLIGLEYPVPFIRLLGYRITAFGVSYFTPGPHFGGEPVQVYLVTKQQGVPADRSIAAVTLDKLFELLANFTFLVAGLAFVLWGDGATSGLVDEFKGGQAFFYAVLLLLLPALVLAAIWRGYHPLSGLLLILSGIRSSPKLDSWQTTLRRSEAQAAFLCRHQPRILMAAMLVSALSWVLLVGEYWLMTRLLGLNLSFGQAILALIAARLAILLPMPAGLGALEASQAVALTMLGFDAAAGVGLALLIRLRDVLLGLLGLWLGGIAIWTASTREIDETHVQDEPALSRDDPSVQTL